MDKINFDIKSLIKEAIAAREFAYAPYSDFSVGAALLTRDNKIIRGCNIENAAHTPTVCAERTAVAKGISEGHKDFVAIAIVGGERGKEGGYCFPCGVCRQVLLEFCSYDDFMVVTASSIEDYKVFTLAQLFPHPFGKESLQN